MTETKDYSSLKVHPALAASWDGFRGNALAFVVAAAVGVLLSALSLTLVTGPLIVGLIKMARSALEGNEVAPGDIFRGFDALGAPLLTWVLVIVPVAFGFMLFVLPGLALTMLWLFSLWFVERDGAAPSAAMAASLALAKHHVGSVSLLLILLIALNALGVFLVVGIFATLPFSIIAITVAFEQLTA